MTAVSDNATAKPATAARIYDYHLGGTHNFPADRAAAEAIAALFPMVGAVARNGRAFLRRAVHHMAAHGVRQFLDIGSGIPTQGNVHDVAARVDPTARVVYVDIDPVAVAESVDLLGGNPYATAIHGDLREPAAILTDPTVTRMLDFSQPVGLLLLAVLHFIADDDLAHQVVAELVRPLAPGSYLAVSHAATDVHVEAARIGGAEDIYRRATATPFHLRSPAGVRRFFAGLDLIEPGITWTPLWRPAPGDPTDFATNPAASAGLVGVARIPDRLTA
jgi:hypothetical protein